jgi:Bacterial Ig-like domain
VGATVTAGDPLVNSYVWSFTTAVQPTVLATVPAAGATGIPVGQVLSATFSKAMNCATLASPAKTFTVTGPGTTAVAGTVACVGAVVTFTPAAPLPTNTLLTAMITTAATDTAGDPLAGNYAWSFRTAAAATQPTVISTVPANAATSVPINQTITATFSVAMNPATISAATFKVTAPGGVAVTGVVTYLPAGSVANFTPAANLAANTLYTATITTGYGTERHCPGQQLRLDLHHGSRGQYDPYRTRDLCPADLCPRPCGKLVVGCSVDS